MSTAAEGPRSRGFSTRQPVNGAVGALVLVFVSACVPPVPELETTQGTPAPFKPAEAPTALEAAPGMKQLRSQSAGRAARRITVRVRSIGCNELGTASGFAVSEHLLVTNRHVVETAEELELNLWDGTALTAEPVSVAYSADLALVEVPRPLSTVGDLATSDPVVGSEITVAGYPNGNAQTLRRGEILEYAALADQSEASRVMRLTANIEPGNSGSPVLDTTGAVVGVVFGIETATGHGLAVPVSALEELIQHGEAPPSPVDC